MFARCLRDVCAMFTRCLRDDTSKSLANALARLFLTFILRGPLTYFVKNFYALGVIFVIFVRNIVLKRALSSSFGTKRQQNIRVHFLSFGRRLRPHTLQGFGAFLELTNGFFGHFQSRVAVHQALIDRKSTRLNSSHVSQSRMPSSA